METLINCCAARFLRKISLKARNAAAQASFVATEVISSIILLAPCPLSSSPTNQISEQ